MVPQKRPEVLPPSAARAGVAASLGVVGRSGQQSASGPAPRAVALGSRRRHSAAGTNSARASFFLLHDVVRANLIREGSGNYARAAGHLGRTGGQTLAANPIDCSCSGAQPARRRLNLKNLARRRVRIKFLRASPGGGKLSPYGDTFRSLLVGRITPGRLPEEGYLKVPIPPGKNKGHDD